MNYRRRALEGLSYLLYLVTIAFSARGDGCSDILQQGIFDQYKITSKTEFQAKVKEFFSKTWDQLQHEHSNPHGEGSFDFFDYFKLNLGGGNPEDKFNQLKSRYESSKDNFFSSSDVFEFETKIVNESVVKAWEDCESGKRVTGWYTAQPDFVVATVHYVLKSGGDLHQVQVSQVLFDSNHLTPVTPIALKDGSILGAFDYLSQSYRRVDKDATFIIINVAGQDQVALTIPPVPTPTPRPTETPKSEWVLETSQREWTFWTPDLNYPGGWPEHTYNMPPMDENHQLRNPSYTYDNIGGAAFSNLSDHRPPVFYPKLEITPDGRSLTFTYKSWSHPFPVHLTADVYRRNVP
jgi:hypothetical protein